MATYKDLEFDEGNDFTYSLALTDSDDVAIDITGYTFYMTVKLKLSISDTDAMFKITVSTIPDPTLGIVNIPITRANTLNEKPGIYPYDIKYKDDSGDVRTIMYGHFKLIQGVTDSVA